MGRMLRPDCLAAESAMRRHREPLRPRSSTARRTTVRAERKGMMRPIPSSVVWRMVCPMRSPFEMPCTSVRSGSFSSGISWMQRPVASNSSIVSISTSQHLPPAATAAMCSPSLMRRTARWCSSLSEKGRVTISPSGSSPSMKKRGMDMYVSHWHVRETHSQSVSEVSKQVYCSRFQVML